MRFDKMTTKSQEAVRAAIDAAVRRGNPEVIPEHVLVAVLSQSDGVGRPLVQRAGADPDALKSDLQARLETLPQVDRKSVV